VLVHFFATWCAGCHDGIVSLQKLANQFHNSTVVVLAINVADLDLRANRYFEKNPVDFSVLLDRNRKTAKAWEAYSLPATFILDRSLKPEYLAETSIDWNRPDIVNLIHGLANR
jgi:thiol-disulfide isomerase/thioredoxin